MPYTIVILRRAQKELVGFPLEAYTRVRDAISKLGEEPRPPGYMKLSGRDGWRIRVGRYRVIHEIDDMQRKLTVMHVGHRRDVYR